MSDTVIKVENLSKQYHIGQLHEQHDTLRDALMAGFQRLRRGSQSPVSNPRSNSTFWALEDVSFEVRQGEVVGIIGRNGAGKSTLLKILSRITEPTSGVAQIRGRIGSLLEVGTGFHPELSGRENIYFSGSILGMKRADIDRLFDEIVFFSGIEKFIDTPVKRYSSGMNVRLGFAVAAHLEPEILLIDEVLAVGDASFQKKCLGKMGDVAREGRTVLFVSHNMAAVGQLCERCMLLGQGNIEFDGATDEAIALHLEGSHETKGAMWDIGTQWHDDFDVHIISVWCEPNDLFIGSPMSITIEYSVDTPQTGLKFGVSIETALGQRITSSYTGREGIETGVVQGTQCATIYFPVLNLTPGQYFLTVAIHEQSDENIVRLERAASFRVISRDLTKSGHLVDQRNGLLWLDHDWRFAATSRKI